MGNPQKSAEARALAIAALTGAGRPVKWGEFYELPQIKTSKRSQQAWWQFLSGMVKSGLVHRSSTKPFEYSIPAEHLPAVVEPKPVKAKKQTSDSPTISVDVDRSTGRLRIRVSGDLTLDLGLK